MKGTFDHLAAGDFPGKPLSEGWKSGGRETRWRSNRSKFALVEGCFVHILLIVLSEIDRLGCF